MTGAPTEGPTGSERPSRSVGHGTATAPALLDLLAGAGITALVDVRHFPGSRRHPHVGQEAMRGWLAKAEIDYHWMEALGGRRKPDPGSANVGLRNPQFRAYADHMASGQFAAAVQELLQRAAVDSIA